MSISYGFFNADLVDGDYDRKYTADQLAEFFSYLIGNGVSGSFQDSFKVVPNSGFAVNVSEGFGWIKGFWVKSDSDFTITDSAVSPSGYRKDLIALRFRRTDRSITPILIQGTVSQTDPASIPEYKRTTNEYDLVLAMIDLQAGDSSITSSMITDLRQDETYCGIIDTFSARLIPEGSIHSESLAEQSVTTLKLALGAVTTERLADSVITAEKLAPASVEESKIAPGAVTTTRIAPRAITTDKLETGVVTSDKLGTDSVITAKILNGAITEAKIANKTIGFGKLAAFYPFTVDQGKDIALNMTANSRALLITLSTARSSCCIYGIASNGSNSPSAHEIANAGNFSAVSTGGHIEITPANSSAKSCLLIILAGTMTGTQA